MLLAHEVGHYLVQRAGISAPAAQIELHADRLAGWLEGRLGRSPAALGAAALYELGCRHAGCEHPDPMARLAAYLRGFEEGRSGAMHHFAQLDDFVGPGEKDHERSNPRRSFSNDRSACCAYTRGLDAVAIEVDAEDVIEDEVVDANVDNPGAVVKRRDGGGVLRKDTLSSISPRPHEGRPR